MSAPEPSDDPDFTKGIDPADIPNEGLFAGKVGDEPVLLARVDGKLVAVGGACTHYGGPLKEGLRVGGTVRCPWHQACFDLKTGAALEAPALAPVDRWKVEERDGKVFIREKLEPAPAPKRAAACDPKAVVIVGGGAAGFAAAQRLRDLGYGGDVTLVSADPAAPYDRPNLSKDYLAGEADPAWMPLKDEAFYADEGIDLRLATEVEKIDLGARRLALKGGKSLAYEALLLATGAKPNRPKTPGFDRKNVFVLRSQADADAIIAALPKAGKVAVLGASFIGLEAAAALVARGLTVHVIAPEALPLEAKLGAAFGRFVKTLHESHGVRFHLGRSARGFDGTRLELDDGTALEVDLAVLGVGVAPRLDLAEAAGLTVDKGVMVDALFRTSAPGVFAAGDIARFPDPMTGEAIRVEHWVMAQRHGQLAAASILGEGAPLAEPPFFWSRHYDDAIHYVGHAERWDSVEIDGDLAGSDAVARFIRGGQVLAQATIGRDDQALRIRQEMTQAIAAKRRSGVSG